MSIKIFFADLRTKPSRLLENMVTCVPELTALEAVARALGQEKAKQITSDLLSNNPDLTVSWNNLKTGEQSEIGGVGSLDWKIPDNSVLSVVYENEATSQEQIDESIEWMLASE